MMRVMILVMIVMLGTGAMAQSKSGAKMDGAKSAKPEPGKQGKSAKPEPGKSEPKLDPKVDGRLVSQELDFTGMVEVSSVKKNEPQSVSVWTTFPVSGEAEAAKLLKQGNQMMKIKAVILEKNGQLVLRIKKAVPVEEGRE